MQKTNKRKNKMKVFDDAHVIVIMYILLPARRSSQENDHQNPCAQLYNVWGFLLKKIRDIKENCFESTEDICQNGHHSTRVSAAEFHFVTHVTQLI